MTKAEREQVSKFNVGDKVVIVRSNYHPDVIGKIGTVKKVIKTRLELLVYIDGGFYPRYEQRIKEKKPDYQMAKCCIYKPSVYNVERVED